MLADSISSEESMYGDSDIKTAYYASKANWDFRNSFILYYY